MPTKVCLVKAMVFPVAMYGCESWTVKKAEHWRIDVYELWYWRRLFRVPWTARRSNQSILKEIRTECSLEGLMLKLNSNPLATWCEELTHWKRPWCWERLKVGGERDNRGWDGWMAWPTQWTRDWVNSEVVMDREAWCAAVHGSQGFGHMEQLHLEFSRRLYVLRSYVSHGKSQGRWVQVNTK